ncbi:MAG: FHA domain-containing protein [Thermosynechococcaceae cyanobacterium]
MTELTLTWLEGGSPRTEVIIPPYPSKNPGTIRLGRDPNRCDIVLNESSVSGLQAEIFYDARCGGFYVRSLRDSNPPIINGQPLPSGEVPLGSTNTIQLGRLQLSATCPIPATDVVSSGGVSPPEVGGVPPTIISTNRPPTPPAPPPNDVAQAAVPPPTPTAPPPNDSIPAASVSQPSGPKIWVWLIAGIVVIAGGALAVPAITNLIGGGGTTEPTRNRDAGDQDNPDRRSGDGQPSDAPSPTSEEDDPFQEKMGDLVDYTHENNLFTIKVPRTWQREDNSKPNEAIVVWTDPDTGSTILINLFRANRTFNQNQLGEIATETLRETYRSRPDYRLAEPEFFDDHVRVKVQFSTPNGTLLGRTFIRQVDQMVSAPRIYILESQVDAAEDTVQEILDSYRFFPKAPLP